LRCAIVAWNVALPTLGQSGYGRWKRQDKPRQSGTTSDMVTKAERERSLRERFGEVLTLSDLAIVLRYPSVSAIRKAKSRGRLPIALVQMPPRRGWFATAGSVAELLCTLEDSQPHTSKNPSRIHESKEVHNIAHTR